MKLDILKKKKGNNLFENFITTTYDLFSATSIVPVKC